MRYILLVLGSFLVPSSVFAIATEVTNLLDTDCATSSDNVHLTSNTFGYEAYLYGVPDAAPATWISSGACTFANSYNCNAATAPANGKNPEQIYNDGGVGPTLSTGDFMIIEDSNSTPCSGATNGATCIANADPGQYQTFKIVADIADCTPTTPSATSTTTTIDRAVNMADFLVDIFSFAIMLGVLFLKR